MMVAAVVKDAGADLRDLGESATLFLYDEDLHVLEAELLKEATSRSGAVCVLLTTSAFIGGVVGPALQHVFNRVFVGHAKILAYAGAVKITGALVAAGVFLSGVAVGVKRRADDNQ